MIKASWVLIILIVATPTLAQAPSSQSISIGDVSVRLGESQQVVLGKLKQEYSVEGEDNRYLVYEKGGPTGGFGPGQPVHLPTYYGSVEFKAGRLYKSERDWKIYDSPDPAVALIKAAHGIFLIPATHMKTVWYIQMIPKNPNRRAHRRSCW